MLTLKCTKAVQALAGLKPSELAESKPAILGAWYVNQFDLGRRKALIFMSESTLVSFVHVGARKPDCTKSKLPFIFLDGLFRFLRLEQFHPEEISLVMDDCHTWQFAKTDSKKSIGNMNELVWQYRCYLGEDYGGESLDEIHAKANRIPQSNLEFRNAVEAARVAVSFAAT